MHLAQSIHVNAELFFCENFYVQRKSTTTTTKKRTLTRTTFKDAKTLRHSFLTLCLILPQTTSMLFPQKNCSQGNFKIANSSCPASQTVPVRTLFNLEFLQLLGTGQQILQLAFLTIFPIFLPPPQKNPMASKSIGNNFKRKAPYSQRQGRWFFVVRWIMNVCCIL